MRVETDGRSYSGALNAVLTSFTRPIARVWPDATRGNTRALGYPKQSVIAVPAREQFRLRGYPSVTRKAVRHSVRRKARSTLHRGRHLCRDIRIYGVAKR